MSTPFLGEIKIFSFDWAPKGWALCNGQILSIQQNQALFALLGTNYGGNGVSTFALPNLLGRWVFGFGQGPGLSNYVQGEAIGAESVSLLGSQIPAHTHSVKAVAGPGAGPTTDPSNALWSNEVQQSPVQNLPYSTAGPNTTLAANAIGTAGGSAPHENRPPFLVVSYAMALQGIFPSRN